MLRVSWYQRITAGHFDEGAYKSCLFKRRYFQVSSSEQTRRLQSFGFFFLVASNCPNMTPRKFCFLLNRTSDDLLWQSVTSRSIFVNGAGSRGQSLTEVESRINGENKRILPVEQRAAGFCCPCRLEPPHAPPPSACEILHCCGRLRENTWKRQKHV